MGNGCLPTVATVAGLFFLAVSGILLLLAPFYNDHPGVSLGSTFLFVLIGLPGAASGFCIRWSCTKGRSLLFAIAALALLAGHILLIIPVYLGMAHLYGLATLVLLVLCIWNLVRISVEHLRHQRANATTHRHG